MKKLRIAFLVFVLLAVSATAALAGWDIYATVDEYEQATGKKITKYNEAPAVAKLVQEGKLPPLDERLPKEPLVVIPEEEIGQYGGTWRRVWKGPGDQWGIYKLSESHLVYWDAKGGKFLPAVAKKWDISDDARVYTFYLREGIKWSDGHPYTVDDILFWYEDFILNDDLVPSKPSWLMSGGKLPKIIKLNDYAFRIEFVEPHGLFLLQLAYRLDLCGLPKHYMKQFHVKYASKEELEKALKAEDFDMWESLFEWKRNYIYNPDLPSLNPWKPANDPMDPFYIMERNPYYWKVDPEGNQLPYIDQIRHEYVASDDLILIKAISGEIDMQWRHIGVLGAGGGNYTLLAENAQKGNYRILNWIAADGAVVQISLNQTHKDPVLRKIFTDKRFRYALSHAIDREEINEIIFAGLAQPMQASFVSLSPYYSEEWRDAYVEFDLKKANRYLDEMGLKWDAKKQYRLRPDGKPLSFAVQVTGQTFVDVCTMIKDYWAKIGVQMKVDHIERSLWESRLGAGEFDAQAWMMDRAAQPLASPYHIIPAADPYFTSWYVQWAYWLTTDGKEGEKPPADVMRLVELWEELKVAGSDERINELMQEVVKIHKENIWMIGTVGEDISPGVVKNNFRNVPMDLVTDDVLRTPLNGMPCQFFFKQK